MSKKNSHEDQLKSIYLGKWVIVNKTDGDNMLEAVRVDVNQRKVVFSNGQQIDMITLDHSGEYERVQSPSESPEVANEIRSVAHSLQSTGIKDDATGEVQKESIVAKLAPAQVPPTESPKQDNNPTVKSSAPTRLAEDTEDEAFVRQLVSMSRKKSSYSDVMKVTINIPVDFDIVKVIENSEGMSIDTESIAKVIVEELCISDQVIRDSVKDYLLSPPSDELPQKTESEKILTEELDKHSRTDDTAELNEDNIDLSDVKVGKGLPVVEFNNGKVDVK